MAWFLFFLGKITRETCGARDCEEGVERGFRKRAMRGYQRDLICSNNELGDEFVGQRVKVGTVESRFVAGPQICIYSGISRFIHDW